MVDRLEDVLCIRDIRRDEVVGSRGGCREYGVVDLGSGQGSLICVML